jgi:lysine 6-dehydrogenase|tara:strand:- start:1203 stop:2288 length:1086 start_codon:yes stop_codon:yes gene_type:complete
MRALILGVGRMGKTIVYAMGKLGHEVAGADSFEAAAEGLDKEVTFYSGNDCSINAIRDFEPDVVISSLPYHQLEEPAKYCIDNGVRYCDLGGRVDISASINEYAKEKATKPIMTDLGLAPGLVNILAEWGCSKVHSNIDEIKMMVGGLPAIKTNPPLNYAVTWSVDGLINEYKDDCEVLIDGKIETVKGMDGREKVSFELMGDEKLEAFYTSGGASHTIKTMQERGVKDCSYKTIRYDGHRDVIRFLIRNAELSKSCLETIFHNGCEDSTGDIVLVKAQVRAGEILWNKEIIIGYDSEFSAMQKATAFSISSVASIIGNGKLEGDKEQSGDRWEQYSKTLSYADVPFDEFNKNLKELGIEV